MWHLVWALPATVAIAIVWGVSAVSNFTFGATQGTSEVIDIILFSTSSAQINGLAAVAVDVLKSVMPAMVVVSWMFKRYVYAAGAALCFVLCLAFSAQNSIGYVLSSHSSAVDTRGQTADQWEALTKGLDQAEKQRALVPEHRPLEVVAAEMKGKQADRKFADSAACSKDISGSINFCREYRGLTAERAAGESAASLDGKLTDLREQLDKRKKLTDADPLASAAAMLGLSRSQATGVRSIGVATLFEVLSAIGLALVWGLFAEALQRSRAEKALRRAEKASQALKVVMPEPDPAALPALPAAVSEPETARNPAAPLPPPPGARKLVTKKAMPTDAVAEAEKAAQPLRVPLKLVERADGLLMPEFASTFFEESAPPIKQRRQRDADRTGKKREARRSAQLWLDMRTTRTSDPRVMLPIDDAWNDYREYCEQEKIKRISKSSFETALAAAKVGKRLLANRWHYVGLLMEQERQEEKLRAFG